MSTPITLEPGEYWRFQALELRLHAARQQHATARRVHVAALAELAEKYPVLTVDGSYDADDDACTLTRRGGTDG